MLVDGWAPEEPGDYELLLDVVEQGVTWFHERGSAPARVALEVRAEGARLPFDPQAIVAELAAHLLERPIRLDQASEWTRILVEGTPIATLAAWIAAAFPSGENPHRLARGLAAAAERLGLATASADLASG